MCSSAVIVTEVSWSSVHQLVRECLHNNEHDPHFVLTKPFSSTIAQTFHHPLMPFEEWPSNESPLNYKQQSHVWDACLSCVSPLGQSPEKWPETVKAASCLGADHDKRNLKIEPEFFAQFKSIFNILSHVFPPWKWVTNDLGYTYGLSVRLARSFLSSEAICSLFEELFARLSLLLAAMFEGLSRLEDCQK